VVEDLVGDGARRWVRARAAQEVVEGGPGLLEASDLPVEVVGASGERVPPAGPTSGSATSSTARLTAPAGP
jgi:hypothetical protein